MLALMACSLVAGVSQTPAIVEQLDAQLAALRAKPDDLQTALVNHPDVQIAEAELRLAQAKLAKAKLLVAQQITAAKARVEQARMTVDQATRDHARVKQLSENKTVSASELATAAAMLTGTKATLAAAEADLKAMTVASPAVNSDAGFRGTVAFNERTIDFLRTPYRVQDVSTAAPSTDGPSAVKLRAALAAPCKLDLPADAKLTAVCDALTANLATHGLTLRAPVVGPADEVMTGGPFQGERPLGQWLQAVADTFSGRQVPVETSRTTGTGGRGQASISYYNSGRREFFARDYGLLFTTVESAPSGAVTLAEFAKQKPKVEPDPTGSPELRDKLRAVLGKVVKLEGKPSTVGAFLGELFATGGSELTVQCPPPYCDETFIVPAGERPLGAWLQLIQDRVNGGRDPANPFGFFVREYGLLFDGMKSAPPGAVPLSAVK